MEGVADEEARVLADDLELGAARQHEAAVEVPEPAFWEGEGRREADVDAARPDDLLAAQPLGLSGQQPDRAEAVATDVHQRASVELGVEPHVVGRAEAGS